MKSKLLIAVIVVTLVFGVVKWVINPTAVRAPSMMARVVDGTTGQPVSGARVVVSADIAEGLFSMCGPECSEIYRYTTITDANGYFVVPAWGPKPVSFPGRPDSSFSPWVQFEKDGYELGPGEKGFSGGLEPRPSLLAYLSGVAVMSSSWDHRKILLYKKGEFPRGPHSDIIPLDKPVG